MQNGLDDSLFTKLAFQPKGHRGPRCPAEFFEKAIRLEMQSRAEGRPIYETEDGS